jgi:RNA polymerase sigma-70 factor (ECF subfamily)
MDDRQIIEAFLNRRDDAVKHLFEKYFSYCFKIAWNILFNKEDSDECVNDTGLRTWESIPPNEPDSLRAYVGRITRNLAITRVENSTARKRGGGQLSLCLDQLSECGSGCYDTLDIADRMTL